MTKGPYVLCIVYIVFRGQRFESRMDFYEQDKKWKKGDFGEW